MDYGIAPERIRILNQGAVRDPAEYVLYWMQQSQRTEFNHALEYAVMLANALKLPLVTCFGVTDNYPEANERHYAFMLEGLRDVNAALAKRGIPFVVLHEHPPIAALRLAKQKAALIVTDRGYLRVQRQWRQEVAEASDCPVVEIEADVIVPVETASSKEEYAARTLRPRINRQLARFLVPLDQVVLKQKLRITGPPHELDAGALDVSKPIGLLPKLNIDRTVKRSGMFEGGERAAAFHLKAFISQRLADYADARNRPGFAGVSDLSPYLHFGQISPLQVALAVQAAPNGNKSDVFLEELIVRRELSINFVYYNPNYDSYDCIPEWARRTLGEASLQKRSVQYSLEQLEEASTHDEYWNAAQMEMVKSGKMHNTMRMYWGKKIIEWTQSPEEAFEIALYLNNRYELDGRDANSYAGVAWLFGKHDRPWQRRPVFGTVRSMTAGGLKRKYDMDAYVKLVRGMPE